MTLEEATACVAAFVEEYMDRRFEPCVYVGDHRKIMLDNMTEEETFLVARSVQEIKSRKKQT